MEMQFWQLAPALPHTVSVVPVWHVPLVSQQPAQVAGPQGAVTHAWFVQTRPAAQLLQSLPPVPQAVLSVPVWQTPLASQQPFGQLAELQTLGAVQLGAPEVAHWLTPPQVLQLTPSDARQVSHAAPPCPQKPSLAPA
jgi:hypothetical protein